MNLCAFRFAGAGSGLAPARKSFRCRLLLVWLLVALLWCSPLGAIAHASSSVQPYLDRVAEQVSEFTLENGMKFIVLERHQAPVVSFMLYANVGAVDEPKGKTGVAHYLEHLAFKGSQRIGTTDYGAEQALFAQMDERFQAKLKAEASGDSEQAAEIDAQLEALQKEANTYVEQNKYGQIVEQAGGVGLNATTGADATRYFYSLPANKLELWMSLESERFSQPVFRQFFEEKAVILEERRMRVDNSPIGLMIETFLEKAFETSPYGRPVIGYEADLYRASRQDVRTFFDTHYVPGNLVAAVVGDVEAAEVQRLASDYFGRLPAGDLPPPTVVNEPPQRSPKEFTLELPSQPWYLEGYHRPAITDPEHVIYGIIESLLVDGRTSRLYKSLVDESQVALDIGSVNGLPGDKYPSLFLLYALTAPNHTTDEVATLLEAELDRLKTEPVDAAELERVKTQARAGLVRSLDSNQGLASRLAEYEAKTGSWRNAFTEIKAIEDVSTADVQQIAQQLFQPQNRTVGRLVSVE
ncbi:MAG: insulinase family protein [Leptolyngbyaceae cyanobacterium SM1_1_3]|nr:insulinase family protein [Leptolyngbyaceae cyanobacterium SM1_1_3]NJN01051.1 insulinase family protein [Leptolyngbyaceae cyanobacterium RM1_1_2]NJO11504.1 insulinase family protein [Leptolyngbyaceae cyanobacterium SL_1_1]